MQSVYAVPASPTAATTVEWRAPAVRYAVDELGLPDDRLVRILDVRIVRRDEAWVALIIDDTQVVVGLRRETCGAGAAADGWFRLLYLFAGDTVVVQRSDQLRATAVTGRPEGELHG